MFFKKKKPPSIKKPEKTPPPQPKPHAEPPSGKFSSLFSKAFLAAVLAALLLSLSASLGILKVNQKAADFIRRAAAKEVLRLKKQTGVDIQWGSLRFKAQNFSVSLNDIVLRPLDRKKTWASFLDGEQRIQRARLRPGLLFLLKRDALFSKIEIQGGQFAFKADENIQGFASRRRSPRKKSPLRGRLQKPPFFRRFSLNKKLPFKKTSLKNTDITVRRDGKIVRLSQVRWKSKARSGGHAFSISARALQAKQISAQTAPLPSGQNKSTGERDRLQTPPSAVASAGEPVRASRTAARGTVSGTAHGTAALSQPPTAAEALRPISWKADGFLSLSEFSFNRFVLSHKKFRFQTDKFEGSFNFGKRELSGLQIESRGRAPFESLRPYLSFFTKNIPQYEGEISYQASLEKKPGRKLKGRFDLQATDGLFQNIISVAKLRLKGRFIQRLLIIEKSSLFLKETSGLSGGALKSLKGEIRLDSKTAPFQFEARAERFSLDAAARLLKRPLPLRATVSGALKCQGRAALPDWNCEGRLHSLKWDLVVSEAGGKTQQAAASFYNMNVLWNLKHLSQNGRLSFQALKEESADLQGNVLYSLQKTGGGTRLDLKGRARFPQDVQIHGLDLQGALKLESGLMEMKAEGPQSRSAPTPPKESDSLKISGELQSDRLNIAGYQTVKARSSLLYQNNRLSLENFRSETDKSRFDGSLLFDFAEKALTLNIQSSFFLTEDALAVLKNKIPFPLKISGAGEAALFLKHSFNNPLQRILRLKGVLFNARLQGEFFSDISFDLSSEKGEGLLRFIKFRKPEGKIALSGSFDSRFHLDLDIQGSDLALESLQVLNRLIPFNQSGTLNFKMKMTGPLSDPKAEGELHLSQTALYTYPAKDSRLKARLSKRRLFLEGRLMEDIHLKRLVWPFHKDQPLRLQGRFDGWDFLKAFHALRREEVLGERLSYVKGDFDLSFHKGEQRGFADVETVRIQDNSQRLKSRSPFRLRFKDSEWRMDDALFEDEAGRSLRVQTDSKGLLISGELSLKPLALVFPELRRIRGLTRVFLRSGANLRNFNPQGRIAVQEGGLSVPPFPPVRNISLLMTVNGGKMIFQNLAGSSRSGSVTGKGFLIYSLKKPAEADVQFTFQDIALNIPKGFSTSGDGALRFQGKKPPYSLSGDYNIRKGLITKEFSAQKDKKEDLLLKYGLLEEKAGAPEAPFHLSVQFKTPGEAIRVKNSFIEAALKGGAKIYGPTNKLRMSGEFNILQDTGKFSFRGQEFQIQSGKVLFNEVPPENPSLAVEAQTLFAEKSLGGGGLGGGGLPANQETVTEYSILLSARGPADSLTISLESFPYLSEKEIVSMLTLGMGSRRFDTQVRENITQYSYQLLGSLLLRRPLGREIRDRFGLELGIAPHINIQKNEPVTKITLKKTWLKSLETFFSRTLEESPQSDVRLKYKLSRRVALTAFWENQEVSGLEDTVDSRNKAGVDLETAFEF